MVFNLIRFVRRILSSAWRAICGKLRTTGPSALSQHLGTMPPTDSTEQLEHTGTWWDPEKPDEKWDGTLRFDSANGAILAVVDHSYRQLGDYEAILGQTTSGRRVTLLNCFDQSTAGSVPGGVGAREIFANAVLIGFHADSRDPPVPGGIAVYRHIHGWWGRTGISVDRSSPNPAVHYAETPSVTLFRDDEIEIKIDAALTSLTTRADAAGRFSLREEVRVELRTSEARPLSFVQDRLHTCQDLLSVACQRFCGLDSLTVLEESGNDLATYHAIPIYKESSTARARSLMRPLFEDIASDPERVFKTWFGNAELLRPVRALYFVGIYSDSFLEGRFLALTQATEAYHRRCRGGKFIDEVEFENRVSKPLLEAIPTDIDRSLRDALRMRIKYGNDYSLRKRLKLLVEEHTDALGKVLTDVARFVGPIVDYRNSLTHLEPASDDVRPTAEDRLRYNFVLRLLLELCFLNAMGFSEDEIVALAERCEEYRQRAHHLALN